jgi:hypothetical protein
MNREKLKAVAGLVIQLETLTEIDAGEIIDTLTHLCWDEEECGLLLDYLEEEA